MANTARINFDASVNFERFETGNTKGMLTGISPNDAAVVAGEGGNQAAAFATSVIANKFNSSVYTGSAAGAIYLPPAVEGTLVVFEFAGDVDDSTGAFKVNANGGFAAATGGSAYAGNVFATQTLTIGGTTGKKSAASNASVTLIYTPTGAANNVMGDAGSQWWFYCKHGNEWMVKARAVPSGTGETGLVTWA
jgi:hypothetical protein